ncbi:MAG: hypothetical protein WCR55_11910, partial [Lentisphaerota bacterium]
IRWQPDIDEIDRIISTHTMAFDKDCYLASGGAAGALLASSKMYNKLGGFFYKYSGYGYSDYDAMEIFSRYHSYADTMSFGIFSYHMGHSKNSVAQKERLRVHKLKFIEIRPLSWKECEPNDWGMADKIFDFQIPKTGAPDYLMRTVRNDFLDQTTLNTIGNMDIKKIVLRTITSLNYTKKDICPTGKQIQNLDAMYILSWWATHSPPSSFLVCPFDIRAAAAISTAGSLCTDIYAILNQEGVIKLKDSWASHANNLQHFFKHKGYLRVVNGPIKTAIERLLNSMIRKPSFDLILFQLHKLDDSWQNVLSQAWERLTPGGAIVFCEDSAQIFNIQWDKIKGIIGISAQYIKFTDCNAGVVIRLKNLDGCEAITTSLELYNGRKLSCLDIYLYWLNKLFDKFTHKIFGLYSRFVHWTLKN